ncbi:MAG TPA: YbaY family lipoprotein [Longimicrobiaceae bacterium]|nr:YbaY family lipoprotein [Longimicrobiaceae bacterium]
MLLTVAPDDPHLHLVNEMSAPHHPDSNRAGAHHHATGRRPAGILRIVAVISVVAAAGGCALNRVRDEPGVVSGTVKVSPKMRLNPGDYVHVTLYAPAGEIAEDVVRAPRKLPVSFVLRYDPAQIDPARLYYVRAAVLDSARHLRALAIEHYPVITLGGTNEARVVAVPNAAATASGVPALFRCAGGASFRVELGWTRAYLTLGEKSLELPVAGRSHRRFADATHTLTLRGDSARLERAGQPALECAGEPMLGWSMFDRGEVDLYARSTEPGAYSADHWLMTVREGARIEFRTNGWRTRVLTSAPHRKVDRRTGRITYRAHSPAHRLIVVAEPGACADGGDTFPMRVTVLLDRRELHGCGGPSAYPQAAATPR